MSRGSLIVFEGLDRSGKTTQCTLLRNRLQEEGQSAVILSFPDRTTTTGQLLDSYLRKETTLPVRTAHLLFMANRWEKAQTIRQLVASGTTVIVDRYYYSGCVYAAAQDNSLTLAACRQLEIGLPRPDICIFLDVPPTCAEGRPGFGGELPEELAIQERARDLFAELLTYPAEQEDSVLIEGRDTPQYIANDIYALLETHRQEKLLRTLSE